MPPSNLLLASKIVVVEEPPQIRNIPGVETSIIGFVGPTERGPVREPQFVTSFEEFVQVYGGYTADSDLPLAVEGAFRNGATAVWISRLVHYTDVTDPLTQTAVKGDLTIPDRGGLAGPAILDSVAGPFDLEDGEVLEVNIDGAGADALTIVAAPALVTAGNNEPYALVDGDTLVYQVKMPGSTSLSELRTITFLAADPLISAIGAATAQEIVNVINQQGQGIKANLLAGGPNFEIASDKEGSGAQLVIDAGSTAITAGKFNIGSGTTNGSGNVADVDAVTAAELAGLLTALPLSSGTATVAGSLLRLTSTGTGPAADVVVTASTTALGIFTGALPITQPGTAAAESDSLVVRGKTEGEWIAGAGGNPGYSVVIETATSGDADRFNLRVKRGTATKETWPNLSMDPLDSRYAETIVNELSLYVELEDQFSPAVSPANLPKLGEYSSWANQDDGLTGLVDADFVGSEAGGTGLYAFDVVDDMTILAVPGRATSAVHNAMVQYCEVHRVGTCFAVLDPPEGLDEQGIKAYVETTAALLNLSEFGAIYAPRVKILNPSKTIFGAEDQLVVPPSGHLAGLYARVDASRPGGVYVPPAGVENGVLFGVLGFEGDDASTGAKSWVRDERKRDVVYPSRINPITLVSGSPRHVDGSRTLKGDGNFPSVSERRGVIFIEQSLKQGLLFAKHRNNDRRLRMEVKRSIEAFLLRQYANGAFRGNTPSESFYVDVSDALNTIERIFAGELHARIGLATQKPAEFIILTFTQDTRELEERLASVLG